VLSVYLLGHFKNKQNSPAKSKVLQAPKSSTARQKPVTPSKHQRKSTNQTEKSVNQTVNNDSNFKEFKIDDADSKIGFDGFSDNPSADHSSVGTQEKKILSNVKVQPKTKVQDRKNATKELKKNFDEKEKRLNTEGPKEFKIGDGEADPTEGFESVECQSDQE